MEIEESKVLIQFLLIFRQSGDVLFFLYARRLRGYTATVVLLSLEFFKRVHQEQPITPFGKTSKSRPLSTSIMLQDVLESILEILFGRFSDILPTSTVFLILVVNRFFGELD